MGEGKSITQFKLGNREVKLRDYLSDREVADLKLKFPSVSEFSLTVALRELLRFLYLSAYSPGDLFFPGNHLMDDLWHQLISQTAEYRTLCNKIRYGSFIDHTSISFESYAKLRGPVRTHEEQISWLASYIKNFGKFDVYAMECLPLAVDLSDKVGGGIDKLNELGRSLLIVAERQVSHVNFNFDEFLDRVAENSSNLDSDLVLLQDYMIRLLRGMGEGDSDELPINNDQLELLFGRSTSLAFAVGQHLAALDRLASIPGWIANNRSVWNQYRSGAVLCGLATTHLAKPGGAGVSAITKEDGYLLSGKASWVCGFGIFEHLLVGFAAEDAIVFAIIGFPTEEDAIITKSELMCLNGTSTVSIEFDSHAVRFSEVVSKRAKSVAPIPRVATYVIPEIGIGVRALVLTEMQVGKASHPKYEFVREVLNDLNLYYQSLRVLRSSGAENDLLVEKRDDFNWRAVRLLAYSMGAEVMIKNSLVCRMQKELLFLDTLISSPNNMKSKILNLKSR